MGPGFGSSMKGKFFLIWVFALFTTSCESQISFPYQLAAFSENYVTVSISLDENSNGEYLLSAKFTPLDGYHLYSKDIPLIGVDGLGRPTLLELEKESHMKSLGELIESVSAEPPTFEPKELLVYPSGAVTLSLPVELPSCTKWVEDVVKVTYMSCSERGCKAPVTGKLVPVHIPCKAMLAEK